MKRNVRYVRKRTYKNFSEEDFCAAVKELSWWDVYTCDNANQAAKLLTTKLSTILDTMAPIRTIQVRNKYAPWLSENTKELLNQRNAAQLTASQTKDQDDWRFYKSLRNTATARMKQERKTWEQMKLDSTKHNPSTLWKNVKAWLNWSNSGPPTQLFSGGSLVNSPAGLAGTMNAFFINKVKNLRENIPAAATDPLEKLRDSLKDRECSLSFRAVKPDEVKKVIQGLKNSKSTGTDYIDTWVIKMVAADILAALTHIINLSISKSEFPMLWKHAKVVPLLKKGDSLTPKNYRPVALLPIFSKILERVVFNQFVEYLDLNSLLHPNHHGSRHGHSTATALIQMYDRWVEEVENGDMVGVMMIDLSAAFDMVDHGLLLQKLEVFGLDNKAISWIESYLSNRCQSVFVDGCLSPPLAIECGVPQGSILGPLMYILFTNDVPDLVHNHPVNYKKPNTFCQDCGGTVCYVDDATYSAAHSDPGVMSDTLTNQYKKIAEYMVSNRLVINDDKTHLVVLGTKRTAARRNEVTLQAGNHTILPTKSEKLLGCHINEDLKWKENILGSDQSIIKQVTSRINGLSLVSYRADFATRLMVANGIVVSKMCYLIQLWGGCDSYLIRSLQVLLNRAARAVTGLSCYTSTRRLMDSCHWLSVKQLVVYQTVVMIHKIVKSGSPYYIHERLSADYPYQTRLATTGGIRLDETFSTNYTLTQNSFRFRGAKEYNQIPASIRSITHMTTFKKKLKIWVKKSISLD